MDEIIIHINNSIINNFLTEILENSIILIQNIIYDINNIIIFYTRKIKTRLNIYFYNFY